VNPWRLIFDVLGLLVIAWIVAALLYSLTVMVTGYALDLWDARGEPPKWDYTSTDNSARLGREEETL
jgi:hypothetical protein